MERQFTLDGEAVDLAAFLHANDETFTLDDVQSILALKPGDKLVFGGGAEPQYVLERQR